jgi:tetratricopeptide (TPR) repeat protein
LLAAVALLMFVRFGFAQERRSAKQPCPPERATIALQAVPSADSAAPASRRAPPSPDTQALIEQARTALEDNQLELADRKLNEILARPDGDGFDAHFLRGKLRARIGAIDEALESATRAVAYAPDSADAHVLRAELLAATGDAEQALKHFRAATLAGERDPNNAMVTAAWMRLGETLEGLGYCSAALESYERFDVLLWDTNPEHANAAAVKLHLMREPRGGFDRRLALLARLGRAGECVRVTQAGRERWPDDPIVARAHATALADAGRPAEALELAEAWIARPAGGAAFVPIAIRAASESKKTESWLDGIVRSIEQGAPPAHAASLARALRSAGDARNAVRIGAALLTGEQRVGDLPWDVALAQLATEDAPAAFQTLSAMVRARPGDEPPQRRVAEWCAALRARGDVDSLITAERGRERRDFADNYVLGITAAGLERVDLAEELLAASLKERPDFSPALGYRGRALLARFDWQGAATYAQELLKTNPNLSTAWYIIGQAADGLDEDDRCAEAFRKAMKLSPENVTYKNAFAQHCRRISDFVSAQRYFAEAIAIDAENAEAHEGLVDAYVLDRKEELAREHFERMQRSNVPQDTLRRTAIKIRHLGSAAPEVRTGDLQAQLEANPSDVETAKVLVAILIKLGRTSEAEPVCDAALALAPDDYSLLFVRNELYKSDGRFAEALAASGKLAARYPNRIPVLKQLAAACQAEFELDRAAETLTRLIARQSKKWSEDHEMLLRQQVRLGKYDAALGLLDAGLKDLSNDPGLLRVKANVLYAADRKTESAKLYGEVLEIYRNDPAARDELIEIALRAGAHDVIEEKLRTWLGGVAAGGPEYFEIARGLVRTLVHGRRGDEALKFVKGLQVGGIREVFLQRMWQGDAQAAAGQFDKSVMEYEALMNEGWLRPEQRIGLQLTAVRRLREGEQYERGLDLCERWMKAALEKSPEAEPEFMREQSFLLQALGREREYAQVLERLYRLAPSDPGMSNDLGYTWLELGMNVDQALTMIRYAVANDPMNAAFLDSLAWTYYKRGEFDAALKQQERAVRLVDGQDADQYDHLGDIRWRLEQRKEAIAAWTKATELLSKETDAERRRYGRSVFRDKLRGKLAAAETGGKVEVAATATEPKGQP